MALTSFPRPKANADPDGTAAYAQHELALDQLRDLGEIEAIDFDEGAKMLVRSNPKNRIDLGTPKGFYPGYDREISELNVFRLRSDASR